LEENSGTGLGKNRGYRDGWGVGNRGGNFVSTLKEGDAKGERATWRFI
jgi:hypothetical protein